MSQKFTIFGSYSIKIKLYVVMLVGFLGCRYNNKFVALLLKATLQFGGRAFYSPCDHKSLDVLYCTPDKASCNRYLGMEEMRGTSSGIQKLGDDSRN